MDVLTMFPHSALTVGLSTALFWGLRWTGKSATFASRSVSLVHAVVQSIFGWVCVLEALGYFDPAEAFTKRTMVFGANPRVYISGEVFAGYIVYDFVHLLAIRELRIVTDAIHHTIFLGVSYMGLRLRILQFAFTWLILGEVSTIFLNVRWMLFKAKMEDSAAYFYNGLLLLGSFFFFRVVVYGVGLCYLFLELLPIINESDIVGVKASPYVLLAAYLLNLFWFKQLATKALGVIQKRMKSGTTAHKAA